MMPEQSIIPIETYCADYTLWRRQIFDDMTEEEMDELVQQSLKENPFECPFIRSSM